jgi:hypothetical protein
VSSPRKRASLHKARTEIDYLKQKVAMLQRHNGVLQAFAEEAAKLADSKQAKIDSLMLEFCPDEMTEQQRAEWAKHQRPVEVPQ